MNKFEMTITIDRPVHEVFEFTLNPENTPKWIDAIVKEEAAPLPAGLGTKYRNQNTTGQWTELEITAFEADRMFVMSEVAGSYHVKYTFTPVGERTQLTYIEWTDDGRPLKPFDKKYLEKLKQVIEHAHS